MGHTMPGQLGKSSAGDNRTFFLIRRKYAFLPDVAPPEYSLHVVSLTFVIRNHDEIRSLSLWCCCSLLTNCPFCHDHVAATRHRSPVLVSITIRCITSVSDSLLFPIHSFLHIGHPHQPIPSSSDNPGTFLDNSKLTLTVTLPEHSFLLR